jgi:purine-binding chemotaxis protein CheW
MSQLFLIAHLAGRAVAIESGQVESVVDIGAIVPVPRADRQVRGLAALRSRVVTVIDSRAALGLPPAEVAATRAVITLVDGHNYAILVDSLEDVAPFDLAPLSSGIVLDTGWRATGCGIIERDGEPILAIDLRALVPGLAALAA